MQLLQFLCLFDRNFMADFSHQRLHQQPAAHANAAVNLPNGQRYAYLFQSLVPRKHMLIDAINQGPVKIKEQCLGMIDPSCHNISISQLN